MPPHHPSQAEAARALAGFGLLATRLSERLLGEEPHPLTVGQYLVLRTIDEERAGSRELAERAGVSGAAVSQALRGLAEAGLIESRAAETDRRRLELRLSRTGKLVLRRADARLTKNFGALLSELPAPERHALARAIPTLEALLSGRPLPRRPSPRPPRGRKA